MIKRLISLRLRHAFIGTLTGKDKNGKPKATLSTGRIVGYTILYAFLALFFLFAVFSMAMGLGMLLVPAGAAASYFGLFMLLSLSAIFIFSIFETKAELFDCKDNELLLSLPISTGAIVISRIITVLIYNYLIEAILIIPVVAVYLIFGGNILGVIGSVIIALLIPLLATALASGVGYVVALAARKMKHKTLVTTILSALFMGAYMVFCFGIGFFGGSDGELEESPEDIEALISGLKGFGVIGEAQLLSPIPLLILVLVTALACFVAYYFISKNYIKIITDTRGVQKRVYVEKRSEKKSALHAIVRKELSKMTSSSTLLLNAGSGVIFLVLISVLIILEGDSLGLILSELTGSATGSGLTLAPIVISAIIMSLSMIMFSACSISLEGKSLWILKSIPVSSRDIIVGKAIPNIVISSVLGTLSGVVISIFTGFDIIATVFYIITPITASVAFSFMGIVLNVMKPKLDFTNEAQVVKQSFPVFICTMGGMLFGMALIALSFFFVITGMPMLFLIILEVLMAALAFTFYFLAVTVSARKLDRMQV
ncbi:MAG: hypothetical protein IJY01_00280 [Clostridia bacterium]|nr:hypothetical protein [Clostridia bacterium]